MAQIGEGSNGSLDDVGHGTELGIYVEDGEILISGPTEVALAYVEQLRTAGGKVSAVELTGRRASDLAAALSLGAGALASAQGGVYLKVAEESLGHLATKSLMPTKDGLHTFLAITTEGGKISNHIRFTGGTIAPAQMLSVQAVAVAVALRMAVAETTAAVERVEGKVDSLLTLVHAGISGNVLGLHDMLTHHVVVLEETGTLTSADWKSVANAEIALTTTINKLRKHVSVAFDKVSAKDSIGTRADAIDTLITSDRIDETLALLVVVEDAMFKYQQLRVSHVQRTEPEFLDTTLHSARRRLRDNARLDSELVTTATELLAEAAEIKPLEIHRAIAAAKLSRSSEELQAHLARFAQARRLQEAEWHVGDKPGISDAADEVRRRLRAGGQGVKAIRSKAIDAGYRGVGALGERLHSAAARRFETVTDDQVGENGKDDTPVEPGPATAPESV